MNDTSSVPDRLSVLTLQFDVPPDGDPDWPVVTINVDGVDPFQVVAKDWRGFDPHQMFGKQAPLRPVDGGRRVAVYACSCGIAGCGVIAPVIVPSPDGRRVSWVDFRDYTGVFDYPISDANADDEDGEKWELPDLHFDRVQYLAEVERATKDWSWETGRRKTARLVEADLKARAFSLPPDVRLGWVAPTRGVEGVVLSFDRPADGSGAGLAWRQVLLNVTSKEAEPDDAAADIVAQLLAVDPERCAQVFRWDPMGPRG